MMTKCRFFQISNCITHHYRIGNVEWPAYLDIMTQTDTNWQVVPFTKENNFHPENAAYFDRSGLNAKTHLLPVISNPSNPTGHTRAGDELKQLIGKF